MKGTLSESSWQPRYTPHHGCTHPVWNLCKKERVHFAKLGGTNGLRMSKKFPRYTAPEILNTSQCTESGGKGKQYKKMGTRETRRYGEQASSKLKMKWQQSKRKLPIWAITWAAEHHGFLLKLSSDERDGHQSIQRYRALVDWRKIGIAMGVENKLVRPRAGERHSPCRNRGHTSVPATGLSCWFFPSAFCSVLFFSVSQRLRTDGNH